MKQKGALLGRIERLERRIANLEARFSAPGELTTATPVSPEEIEAARSPRGGWTKAQLAIWGIPWPPPKGWRSRLAALHNAQKNSGA